MTTLQVFIGGIPKNATEAQIKEFSEQAGAVSLIPTAFTLACRSLHLHYWGPIDMQVHSVKLAKDPVNAEQNRG